jgi:hypothetical protein
VTWHTGFVHAFHKLRFVITSSVHVNDVIRVQKPLDMMSLSPDRQLLHSKTYKSRGFRILISGYGLSYYLFLGSSVTYSYLYLYVHVSSVIPALHQKKLYTHVDIKETGVTNTYDTKFLSVVQIQELQVKNGSCFCQHCIITRFTAFCCVPWTQKWISFYCGV